MIPDWPLSTLVRPVTSARSHSGRRRYYKVVTKYIYEYRIVDTWFGRLAMVLAILAVVWLGLFGSLATLSLAQLVALSTVGAVGLNIVTGMAGQISLAHAGFIMIGGFIAGLAGHHGFVPVLLIAVVVGSLFGALVGAPAVRLQGLYLAIATLAFFFLVEAVAIRLPQTRYGVSVPTGGFGALLVQDPRAFYFTCVVIGGLSLYYMRNLRTSGYGRALQVVSSDEFAAEASGVRLSSVKLKAFMASGALGSVAGVLFAYHTNFVAREQFTLELSIEYLAMIIIGGLGSPIGSLLGAAFVVFVPEVLDQLVQFLPIISPANVGEWRNVLYGGLVVGFLLFEPEGLAGMWREFRLNARRWPLGSR